MNHKFLWLSSLFVFVFGLLITEVAFSNTIKTVKGKKALVELTDSSLSSGTEVTIYDEDQKKTGSGKVTQQKGKKAIIEITSGRVDVGDSVVAEDSDFGDSGSSSSSSTPSVRNFNQKKNDWGVQFSFNMNAMNAEETNGTVKEVASMKGTSFGLFGFYDYAFSPRLMIRAGAGYDQFKASSTIAINGCDGRTSKNCTVNINYLSGYGYLKYNITTGKARIFALGGMAMMMAMSKSTTALKEADISTTTLFLIGGGVDIKMSNKTFIPVSIEYGLFPPSESVSANMLMIRGGYGWLF